MEKPNDTRGKAETIRAFLDRHQPKLPEARGFLQFLLAKEEILRRLEITDDLSGCENAILVSAKGSGTWPFFYRRGNRYFFKTNQAVVELMRYVPDPLYLCLSTVPPGWSEEQQEFLEQLRRWHDELFEDEVRRLRRKYELLTRIDEALDRGDQAEFMELSGKLRELNLG